MNATLCELHSNVSSSSFMHGTCAQCLVPTFHAVSLWLAANLPSLSIIKWVNIGSSHPLQPPSKATPKSLPPNSAHATKLRNCSSPSSASGTTLLSTLVAPTHACICRAISSLHSHRATQLDATQDCVGKLEYKFTGPWRIIKSLKGTSYAIKHCLKPSRKEKKHALDLTPYPFELIPFKPINGTDNLYGNSISPSEQTHSKKLA
jgi:hypothetical protein